MDKENTKKKKKKKQRNILKGILVTLLIICSLTFAAGTGMVAAVIKSAPSIDTDIISNLKQSSILYDKDGNFIESLSTEENRTVVSFNQIPKNLKNAVIAIEDERFETHHGIDIKRIFGAVWHDIKTMSREQGASTITQQLIKNYALTPDKKFTRKFQEMYLATQLERKLSKDQILNAYLNTIFLGGNAYGVQSASMLYFGKDVEELTLAESALIAGLTQNPAKFNPLSKRNVEARTNNTETTYRSRQEKVLNNMLRLGYITEAEHDKAINEKLVFQTKKPINTMKYQWFVEPAVDQVAKDLAEKFDISEKEAKQRLRTAGYNVYLTIDTKIQDAAEKVINNDNNYKGLKVPKGLEQYAADSQSKPKSEPQAAAVIYDYATGEMRAIVGGRGEHELQSLNRATEVPRQPGSSIKPLAIYGPAIDTKAVSSSSVIEDTPYTSPEGWSPGNSDGQFLGPITIREAIKRSRNLVAVRLGLEVGVNTAANYVRDKFHISTIVTSGKTNDKNIAALSLGGMTHGVYPYEMAAAYGVFGNGGMYSEPIMYTKVTDRNGSIILEKTSEQSRSISAEAAYLMTDMMKEVIKGGAGATGTTANFGAMPAAGKTGTASDYTNAWFAGLTPYYSGAVWIGHDKPNTKVTGLKSSLAAKMWGDIMKEAHKGLTMKNFDMPSGLVSAQVCIDSGKAPSELCSQDIRGARLKTEIFVEGTQPVEICDEHITAEIDTRNGKLAAIDTPQQFKKTQVFTKSTIPLEFSDEPDEPINDQPSGEADADEPMDDDDPDAIVIPPATN